MSRQLYRLVLLLLAVGSSTQELTASTNHLRLVWLDEPSTTITVAWNQVSGSTATLHYGTTDRGRNASAYPNRAEVTEANDYHGFNNRFVRLSELQPETVYYFVLNDDEGSSDRYYFKTAPATNKRISLILGGDSRNHREVRRWGNELVAKLRPTAVLFGGDMIDVDRPLEWEEWLNDWQLTISSDGRVTPIVPARGNHEAPGTIQALFNTVPGSYYAITWGRDLLRTYTLNTEISVRGDQYNWLADDLEDHPDVRWKIAQYHTPMRAHVVAKPEGGHIYDAWAGLFYDNDVRLVIDSDSHTAKVTWPLRPTWEDGNDRGFVRDDALGTVYAGEGCWGAPLRWMDGAKSWTRDGDMFNQFNLVHVSKDRIELRKIIIDENRLAVAERISSNAFELPTGLNVWSPSNGPVVTILPRDGSKPVSDEPARLTATYRSGRVELAWPVSGNRGLVSYRLERALNGGPWSVLSTGSLASSEGLQTRTDIATVGTVTYRLTQVDEEGDEFISPEATVVVPAAAAGPVASPNPTDGLVTVLTAQEVVSVAVVDGAGREVLGARPGREVDLGGLPAGVYFLRVWLVGVDELAVVKVVRR